RILRRSAVRLAACLPTHQLYSQNKRAKGCAQTECEGVFPDVRRENQDEATPFNQSGKTRNAEWHEEKTKDLPAVEAGIPARGTEHQSKSDDPRKSDRRQPQIAARIKIACDEEEVPNQVAPKDHLSS